MKWKISLSLAAILFLGLVSLALAHGVVISYEANENGEIELQAVFDTGEVMSEAQVSIFSPEDPATPWLTGTADEEGRFTFTPDQPGTWDVQFRKAGHGDIVHITIEEIIEVDVMEEDTPEGVEETEIEAETKAETEEEVATEVVEAAVVENEAQGADADTEAEAAEAVSREETQTEAEVESAEAVSESVDNETVNNEEPTSETEAAAAAETTESAAPPTTQRLVVANSGSDGLTTAQILLMSGSVVWGFIGTALFFARGRNS